MQKFEFICNLPHFERLIPPQTGLAQNNYTFQLIDCVKQSTRHRYVSKTKKALYWETDTMDRNYLLNGTYFVLFKYQKTQHHGTAVHPKTLWEGTIYDL